jgi:hypothetical protein
MNNVEKETMGLFPMYRLSKISREQEYTVKKRR